ncbi:MAG: pilus assembly protein TadG-related protein, partial [Pseudomonadota bacterium]
MSKPEQFEGGFLTELLKDSRANTIAIGAAAMVPLLAMVGGAVDASRYYMTETRLQAACDAGALAARRAMDD